MNDNQSQINDKKIVTKMYLQLHLFCHELAGYNLKLFPHHSVNKQ